MGTKCSVELAPEAITFETDTTLNKKRAAIKVIYSVVVQPRFPRPAVENMTKKKYCAVESQKIYCKNQPEFNGGEAEKSKNWETKPWR